MTNSSDIVKMDMLDEKNRIHAMLEALVFGSTREQPEQQLIDSKFDRKAVDQENDERQKTKLGVSDRQGGGSQNSAPMVNREASAVYAAINEIDRTLRDLNITKATHKQLLLGSIRIMYSREKYIEARYGEGAQQA